MDNAPILFLIAVISAGAGGLSTYVLGRIDRASDLNERREMRQQIAALQRRSVFSLQQTGNIFAKLDMAPRYSDDLYKILALEAGEQNGQFIADTNGAHQ